MNEWIDELADLAAAGEAVVAVTVAGVRGSAPREPGAKMLVTPRETIGTIGGGQLEHECTRIAVAMLSGHVGNELRTFPLGASMGQCCGGVVDILFEPLAGGPLRWLTDLRALHGQREPAVLLTDLDTGAGKCVVTADDSFGASALPADALSMARQMLESRAPAARHGSFFFESVIGSDFNIAVFGAGHVGVAVVAALSVLECNVRWVDNRRGVFRSVPANARAIEAEDPALEVAALPAGAHYLVMTHSHAIDLDITSRILARGDAAYCGLIGSRSKRLRFEKRLRTLGIPEARLAGLRCPIGVDGIGGKKPAEIAVAVAAELLRVRESHSAGVTYPANVRRLRGD